MVISKENVIDKEINFTKQQKHNQQKRIGIIGFGHLGQFLKMELGKSPYFSLQKIWNRTEDLNEGVLPLNEINDQNLKNIDLIIEVSHPDIIHNYSKTILNHTDLFIGSVTALAVEKTYNEIKKAIQRPDICRSVFIPSGALWGSRDIQKMADFCVLKTLSITTMLHPNSLQLAELSIDSSSELKVLHSFCEESKRTNSPKVLYDGPVRQLCLMAPNNVNSMASAVIAAHTLGFDDTRAKLIVDPELRNWQIIEYEVTGENGFRTFLRRENPSQPGVGETTGETTYFSFLSSVNETLHRPQGLNIC